MGHRCLLDTGIYGRPLFIRDRRLFETGVYSQLTESTEMNKLYSCVEGR